ncbi:MAG TPA: asparagine synthase (glutamine-hydrolyzing) [Terriglobia bacterium]|nr:asparagine synthase (glutamine-hydrolyzing) [Terriglobia bacterium]
MCGIAGFLSSKSEFAAGGLEEAVQRMTMALRHRGPDDCGSWVDRSAGIGLGFRRLAILDVSPRGHQPMFSGDGRYGIVFNGEICNFKELRTRLQGLGHSFTSGTDTEVILATAVEWGAGDVPLRLQGMFAYALWDRQQRVLHLARDRVGIKPLYYGWSGETFLFGSELRAIEQCPGFERTVNHEAVELYLDFGYVPTPLSIYKGIQKLQPGTALQVRREESTAAVRKYWDIESAFNAETAEIGEQDAIEKLENLLEISVKRHMISDVPLGALLSGGIDSSAVVAMMCAKARARVKTFSVGFAEKGFDESPHARAVARHLGTDHTEMLLRPQDALDVIPKLPEIYDEPFADSSQIPTFLISRLARQHVTVALTGDGGDEFFGGYNRYRLLPRAVKWGNRLGKGLSSTAATLFRLSGAKLSGGMSSGRLGEGLAKLGDLIGAESLETAYAAMCKPFSGSQLLRDGRDRAGAWPGRPTAGRDWVTQMQLWDAATYLPDDILTKVDRASMSVSLEARVPLLDDELVPFAASLPLKMKIRGRRTKWLLRQVLYRHVPAGLVERPKAGFAVPLAAWLRGPLTEWVESLISTEALRCQDLLEAGAVRREWTEFRSGRQANHHRLWAVLMLQAWHRRQPDLTPEPELEHAWRRGETFASI